MLAISLLAACCAASLSDAGSAPPNEHRSYWLPTDADQPLVVSELGFGVPATITENTIEAFEEGLALGASGVEVTSRLTADGVVAMLHDNVVPGCYGGKRSCAVLRTDFADLPEGTLSLSQYLDAVAPNGMQVVVGIRS